MANGLSPTLLAGEVPGASFEIILVGHMVDKPYMLVQNGPGGREQYWHDDLGVAARAATKWLTGFHPVE